MQLKQRPIDDNESFDVIKDIEHDKVMTAANKVKAQNDIKKVLHAFDTKKKIQIPKSLNNISINNNNSKNNNFDKNERKKNNPQSTHQSFELSEFKRPDSYIIYSSKEREQLNIKDYEAKSPDFLFLEYHGDFMKIEELEKIISALENNIGKSEKIPDEMAKKIIEENFSKYKSESEMIIKYFNDRRSELKKSLLRKYWRVQKSTDKYFTTTFRRRERDKMKIRKNNQKKEESFTKVKMAGDLCQTHLLSIIKSMTDKEMLNRQLIYLDNVAFMSKVSTIQKNKIPKEYVNQNNEIVSFMKKKGINLVEIPPPKIEIKNNEEHNAEKIPIKVKIPKQEVLLDLEKLNSNNAENKIISQEIIEPPLDFSSLKNDYNNKNNDVININNKYRIRIRMNRNKKISVDRYIQNIDSMDPFDDSYNENIINYGKYNPNMTLNSLSYNCFENLLKNYYQQKYKFLDYIIENDDDYDSFFKSKKSNKRLLSKKRTFNK
jgi:hypothetical protein